MSCVLGDVGLAGWNGKRKGERRTDTAHEGARRGRGRDVGKDDVVPLTWLLLNLDERLASSEESLTVPENWSPQEQHLHAVLQLVVWQQ